MKKFLSRFRRAARGSSIGYFIQPRKVRFEWQDTPIDWIPQQPFASYFINEINMILPAGEFWFCRLYNKILPQIQDKKLKQDVQAFIRQEAMHAQAHNSANKDYLTERQIDIQRNISLMNGLFNQLLADRPLGLQLPQWSERHWDLFRLGIVATLEHMTLRAGEICAV